MASIAENYLRDLGALIRDAAREARAQCNGSLNAADQAFALGRVTAYYEVLSLMKQQASAFGLADSDLSLESFDPEQELLTALSDSNDSSECSNRQH